MNSPYVNSGANAATQDANNIGLLWSKGARMGEQTEDILTACEGGREALIETETSTSAGRGHQVFFRTMSGFYGQGLVGEARFADDRTLLEEINIKTHSVKVDLLRNGLEHFDIMEDVIGARGEILDNVNVNMGKWLGREKTFHGFMSAIHQVTTQNHLFANGQADLDHLTTDDTLQMDDITEASALIEPMGGTPAYLGMDADGNPIMGGVFFATRAATKSLRQSSDWKQAQREAGVRGKENLIFAGGESRIDGNIIKEWNPIDHDGYGAIGSPLNAKAFLGLAIVAGTTADLTGTGRGITGGRSATGAGKTNIHYFRFFPRYAFPFLGATALSATATTHFLASGNKFYVRVTNPSNAGADANKWGVFRCTVNSGNEITVDQRLAAAASGSAATTVGSVVWDAAKHTETFAAGSLVTPCNAYGVMWGRSVGMYRAGLRRAYGAFRAKRLTDSKEGGTIQERYIASIFGQGPRQNAMGLFPGLVVLNHAVAYAGWNCTI